MQTAVKNPIRCYSKDKKQELLQKKVASSISHATKLEVIIPSIKKKDGTTVSSVGSILPPFQWLGSFYYKLPLSSFLDALLKETGSFLKVLLPSSVAFTTGKLNNSIVDAVQVELLPSGTLQLALPQNIYQACGIVGSRHGLKRKNSKVDTKFSSTTYDVTIELSRLYLQPTSPYSQQALRGLETLQKQLKLDNMNFSVSRWNTDSHSCDSITFPTLIEADVQRVEVDSVLEKCIDFPAPEISNETTDFRQIETYLGAVSCRISPNLINSLRAEPFVSTFAGLDQALSESTATCYCLKWKADYIPLDFILQVISLSQRTMMTESSSPAWIAILVWKEDGEASQLMLCLDDQNFWHTGF